MQKKYGPDGLVVMTINIDDDPISRQKATEFLESAKTPFANLMAAQGEAMEAWTSKLELAGFPSSFLYNRQGERKERLEGVSHEEMEAKVKGLLAQK